VLVAGDLEGKGKGAVLVEVVGISLSYVSLSLVLQVREYAHQIQDAGWMLLLISVLDEVQQTLSSLAGPGCNTVGNLGLLATEVLAQVRGWDRLLAEPEVFLRVAESAASLSA
jgi:hypothetical protein